jgi:transcriptional repressor OPI1
MQTLTDVRRDVVQTIRQVVDVVSKYAGGALPEPARSRVRGFILHLPQRWANAAQGEGVAKGAGGGAAIGGVPVGNGTRRGRNSRYQHHRERGAGSEGPTPASSGSSSPLASPRLKARRELQANGHGHAGAGGVPPTAGTATQAARRILTLSTESLDMMRGVTAVVKESLDRAEA